MNPFDRHPLISYFALAYLLSLIALVVVGPPRLIDGGRRPMLALAVFPMLVIGVAAAGIIATSASRGRAGLRDLVTTLRRPALARWYAVLLLPPVAILLVLTSLSRLASSDYTPQLFVVGIGFGLVAGFFEEIGWTGFAYPRMSRRFGWLGGAVLLGILWAVWHLPVVDALGAASPHGSQWPEFFAAFAVVVVAMRVLIAWVFTHTGSLHLAQMLHASSTGSLVMLSAPRVTPGQEAVWYIAYGAVLWLVVVLVVTRRPARGLVPAS